MIGSGEPVQTRLRPPGLGSDLLARPRLLQALSGLLSSHPVVLVSAPAGYGKTTLLASLAAAGDVPVAWLSIDEEDNDPSNFLSGLIGALQRVDRGYGSTIQSLIGVQPPDAGPPDPRTTIRRLIGALINDLADSVSQPCVLVLDDVHVLTDAAIFAGLDYLIERLPSPIRLVLATRHDPPVSLARRRGRGQLAELRLEDLRFTRDEVATLLHDSWRLRLSADELATLNVRTEGWPAGLRLLASSLERIEEARGRRALLGGLPAAGEGYVFDFLAEEVVARLEPRLRAFLEETSILSELTPSLCKAVTGVDDAEDLLRELERLNLFIIRTGSGSFRFHDLFRHFLQQRLRRSPPERLRVLHRRAAESETSISQVITHYLTAAEWETAAAVVEREGRNALSRGQLTLLAGWIDALPSDLRQHHPRLLYLAGACAWQRGDIAAAPALLEQAREGFAAVCDIAGEGEALVEIATCALLLDDFPRLGPALGDGLRRPLAPRSRVQLLMTQTFFDYFFGDWTRATDLLEEAVAVAQSSDDPDVLRDLLTHIPPAFGALPGGLSVVESLCRRSLERLGEQPSPARLAVEVQMAFIRLFRGWPEQAIEGAENALALSQQLGHVTSMEVDVTATLAVAHFVRADHAGAERWFGRLFGYVEQIPVLRRSAAAFLALRGHALWLAGRQAELRGVIAQLPPPDVPMLPPVVRPLRPFLEGLVELSDRRFNEAEAKLKQAASLAEAAPHSRMFGSPNLMLAVLYHQLGRTSQAGALLEPLLDGWEREDAPGFLINAGAPVVPLLRQAVERRQHAAFVKWVLERRASAAARPDVGLRVPDTGEVLTPREVEILRLVAAGTNNRGIAEHLVISEYTAKTHIYRIFRKLEVESRTQAAARARKLGVA